MKEPKKLKSKKTRKQKMENGLKEHVCDIFKTCVD